MIIGFTNGCFDLLHDGHRHFLRECHEHCDRLMVGVNSDASVRRLKGKGRPIENEFQRAVHLLKLAEMVCIFDTEAELLEMIDELNPDMIFKGAEYAHQQVIGEELAKVVLIPMLPGYSTTLEVAKRCSGG